MAHLGPAEQPNDADEKYDTDPAAAAGLHGLVADKLQSSPYAPHAPRIRARQADISGARWGLDGAEAILTLRAVISNDDFEEYRRFHLAREHQRLYSGTAQGQYTLGA